MPGEVTAVSDTCISGWAVHPRHAGYPMLVHLVEDGRVRGSVMTDDAGADGRRPFSLERHAGGATAGLRVLLGETDEDLPHPAFARAPRRMLRVEELAGVAVRRCWVNGACHIDMAALGMHPGTIIDLLCRDYLGRPAGPVVLESALAQVRVGGHDVVRRTLLDAGEYRYRRIHADAAPGAIFSQAMVVAGVAGDFSESGQGVVAVSTVSALPLLVLEETAFVTACYRQILRKEPDRAGLAHYLGELARGVTKVAIIRHLASEFETISAGIQVVDLGEAL